MSFKAYNYKLMEHQGKKIYLDIEEQKSTGYSSPVDLETFPLHEEREATDAERDRLEAMTGADDDEITHAERAILPKQLASTARKSEILREMSKLAAMDSMVNGPGA
jgi:hypothetical protein